MKQLPNMKNMLKAMNLSPQAQDLLEKAVANAAMQFGGVQAFFASGHENPKSPLPARPKPKKNNTKPSSLMLLLLPQ